MPVMAHISASSGRALHATLMRVRARPPLLVESVRRMVGHMEETKLALARVLGGS
jgi:hypothetical protein